MFSSSSYSQKHLPIQLMDLSRHSYRRPRPLRLYGFGLVAAIITPCVKWVFLKVLCRVLEAATLARSALFSHLPAPFTPQERALPGTLATSQAGRAILFVKTAPSASHILPCCITICLTRMPKTDWMHMRYSLQHDQTL